MKELTAEMLVEPELVKVTRDGLFLFYVDGGGVYQFKPGDAAYALRWIEHVAQKGWVTKQHLEQFARLAADYFGAGHI